MASKKPASAPARAETEHPHDHDGCLCDHPPTEAEATPDHELPPATGGIAKAKRRRATKASVEGEA